MDSIVSNMSDNVSDYDVYYFYHIQGLKYRLKQVLSINQIAMSYHLLYSQQWSYSVLSVLFAVDLSVFFQSVLTSTWDQMAFEMHTTVYPPSPIEKPDYSTFGI